MLSAKMSDVLLLSCCPLLSQHHTVPTTPSVVVGHIKTDENALVSIRRLTVSENNVLLLHDTYMHPAWLAGIRFMRLKTIRLLARLYHSHVPEVLMVVARIVRGFTSCASLQLSPEDERPPARFHHFLRDHRRHPRHCSRAQSTGS